MDHAQWSTGPRHDDPGPMPGGIVAVLRQTAAAGSEFPSRGKRCPIMDHEFRGGARNALKRQRLGLIGAGDVPIRHPV